MKQNTNLKTLSIDATPTSQRRICGGSQNHVGQNLLPKRAEDFLYARIFYLRHSVIILHALAPVPLGERVQALIAIDHCRFLENGGCISTDFLVLVD